MPKTPLPGYSILNKVNCKNIKRKIINRLAINIKRTSKIRCLAFFFKTLYFSEKLKNKAK